MDLETLLTGIAGIVTSIGTYFAGRKRNKAEIDSLVLQNVKGILEIQTETIEALKREVDELRKKIDGYEEYIEKLETEIKAMRKEIHSK